MKRIIAATAVAALLTVTGAASAKSGPSGGSKGKGGVDQGCKHNCA